MTGVASRRHDWSGAVKLHRMSRLDDVDLSLRLSKGDAKKQLAAAQKRLVHLRLLLGGQIGPGELGRAPGRALGGALGRALGGAVGRALGGALGGAVDRALGGTLRRASERSSDSRHGSARARSRAVSTHLPGKFVLSLRG